MLTGRANPVANSSTLNPGNTHQRSLGSTSATPPFGCRVPTRSSRPYSASPPLTKGMQLWRPKRGGGMQQPKKTRVVVVGTGFVGATYAFALTGARLVSELVLIDADPRKAEGEAMDLSHATAFQPPMHVR